MIDDVEGRRQVRRDNCRRLVLRLISLDYRFYILYRRDRTVTRASSVRVARDYIILEEVVFESSSYNFFNDLTKGAQVVDWPERVQFIAWFPRLLQWEDTGDFETRREDTSFKDAVCQVA